MTQYDKYTSLIGVLGVMFSLSVFESSFSSFVKVFLIAFGVCIFFYSSWSLYRALSLRENPSRRECVSVAVSKISLLDKRGEVVMSWELYGRTSAIIGKDVGENAVDIDLSKNPYAALIDVEHAVMNYADGSWYIEDLDSRNGISIKKFGQEKIYRLSSLQPCKLDFGDVLIIGVCQLKLH